MFKRKYWHEFHIMPDDRDFESCFGLQIDDVNHFIIAKESRLIMYNDITYEELYAIELDLPKSKTRDEIEVISMVCSEGGSNVAISVGKNLITGIEEMIEIIILKLVSTGKTNEDK